MTRTFPLLLAVACAPPPSDSADTDVAADTDSAPTSDTADSDTDPPADTGDTDDTDAPAGPGRPTSCGALTAPFTDCAVGLSPAQTTLPPSLKVAPHTDALVADLDEDGWLDVCASRFPGPLTCWRDAGGLTFTTPPTTLTEGASFGSVATDLDGDGHVDVAVLDVPVPEDGDLSGLTVRLRILKGKGDGTFDDITEAAGLGQLPPPGCDDIAPAGLSVLHLDGDGRLDLVVRMTGTCRPYVYKGKPNTRWERSISTLTAPVETGLLTFDLDRDGHLDLFAYSFGEPASSYYKGKDGTFTATALAPPFTGAKVTSPMGCGAGDIDGDGLLDVYCSDHGHQTLLKLDSQGQAFDVTAAQGAAVPTTLGGEDPISWAALVVDLDGRDGPDLVSPSAFEAVSETWDQELLVLLQGSDGRFTRQTSGPLGAPAQERGMVLADFDGNTCPDLLLLPADFQAPGAPLRLLLGAGCTHPFGGVTVLGANGQEAVGATLTARWADDSVGAWRVTKTGGYAGVGPAQVWPSPRVPGTALAEATLYWTDGSTSAVTAADLAAGLVRQPAPGGP
ncbi:MAG: VCBS repeat-containing protein [Alphaproteobacteria bacterium]|nr:VCBS repeat-containing protein [Alphaproteobacteria bacterium]